MPRRFVAVLVFIAALISNRESVFAQELDVSAAAQAYRKASQPVRPISDKTILCEAEEFRILNSGWEAKRFGTNYFAATFANAFLSRRAYLGAPAQCKETIASINVNVPKTGRYLVLVRYESCYKFETQFRVRVVQNGKTKLNRLYGARDNVKIWAFRQRLKKEVAWSWGAGENIVWEGHDAYVNLQKGTATIFLVAGKQPKLAAKRNIDLVMLTSDEAQVKLRIEKENYLPLDGMLTQAGDLYLKLHNRSKEPVTLRVPNGTEHSPYWVHLRYWKPKSLTAKPGQSTEWVEVGSLLDTLSHGQWKLTGKGGPYDLEFAVKDTTGKITSIKPFENLSDNVTLAYDANTRYTRRIRLADDVLYELVDYLKKRPVKGIAPKRTLIFGTTFNRKPGNAKYNAAIDEFVKLIGATALKGDRYKDVTAHGVKRGYIDVRGVPTPKLEAYCKKLQAEGRAKNIAVVSMGDEIGLARPPGNDHAGFRAWLNSRNIKPADVDPAVNSYDQISYSPSAATSKSKPGVYYYSKRYAFRFGIKRLQERTDILRRYLPNAHIGAIFSPHHGHMYLGPTHQWISVFREGGMTMPWGEDYIFQVPVGSQQMNSIMVDMYRAAIKNKPGAKIHYYVMAHAPNNTTRSWRRLFYGDLAHGVKDINLFEFRPVQAAYTENHVNDPAMYQAVRKAFHELGKFEDIIQDGKVDAGLAGLWFSEAGDVWDNNRSPFDAAKRTLYIAIRNQQIPLDVVVEGDNLSAYKALYLTDQNVSRKASKAIADWVRNGGRLFATAGAGMFDELNQPNSMLRKLFGVDQQKIEEKGEPIRFAKQDLPFAKAMDTATWKTSLYRSGKAEIPVFGLRSRIKSKTAKVEATFSDRSPALTVRQVGKGSATYCAFLPGLSYFKPAMPLRPMDRGATDDSMTHFLATSHHWAAGLMIGMGAGPLKLPVHCSSDRVETTVIRARKGTVLPLINWNPTAVKNLKVTIHFPTPMRTVTLASGSPVRVDRSGKRLVCTFDLDVADALILR